MADPRPDPSQHTGGEAGAPRWVKVFWVIAAVLVLLVLVLLLSGRGHGPGRHISLGGTAVMEVGVRP